MLLQVATNRGVGFEADRELICAHARRLNDARAAPPSTPPLKIFAIGGNASPKRLDQENRHPDQDQHDHQQRNLDKPGEPDPGAAMPFIIRVDHCHVRLAAGNALREV
jgi:hypothetical protein